jgi:hypothetical protein
MKRFKNMLFDNLTSLDCNDSTTGICHKNLTLNQCEELIKKEGENDAIGATSGAGYFIDSDPSICVPINTSLHPYLNPSYRLRPKEEILKVDVPTYAFINTKKYDFPPKNANSVFYNDRFRIIVRSTDDIQINNQYLDRLGAITNSIDKAGVFQFIRFQNTIEKDSNYIPCRVNTLKIINIPGTNLILCNQDNNLVFKSALSSVADKNNAFKFIPIKSTSSITINYNQKFYITYQDVNYVGIDEELNPNRLSITSRRSDSSKQPFTFELIPLVDVYYCDNASTSRIRKIPLKSCKTENEKASFDGNIVYRSENCFGVCKKSQTLYILIFLILVLFLVSFALHRL